MRTRRALALCLFLVVSRSLLQSIDINSATPELSADAIVEKLQAANLRRAESLRAYTSRRTYTVDYHGFPGGRHAEMTVEADYTSPDSKQFTIVSQSGSKLLQKRVLLRLLDSEREALQGANRQRTELSPENYSFTLLGTELTPEGECYVMSVGPKIQNKFLYRGKIWVHAGDFAVARIEGEPAANPSWWITRTRIRHEYTKIGDFWLPLRNQSTTRVRLGGEAVLTIEYNGYKINLESSSAGAK